MNINSEIYYWMTEAANLGECTEPVLRFFKEMAVNATVKSLLGEEGIVRYNGIDTELKLKKGETKKLNGSAMI